jgi:hypothetical protein
MNWQVKIILTIFAIVAIGVVCEIGAARAFPEAKLPHPFGFSPQVIQAPEPEPARAPEIVFIEAKVLDKCKTLEGRYDNIITDKGTLNIITGYMACSSGAGSAMCSKVDPAGVINVNETYLFKLINGVIVTHWTVEEAGQYCELRPYLEGAKPCLPAEAGPGIQCNQVK